MPRPIVIPTATQELSWVDLRKGLRDCVKAVATTARVYSRWPLKYDIGKTVTLLESSSEDRVHAWIISINKASPYNEKAGGNNLQWDLTVRIWGFLGYEYGLDDDDNAQNILEEEARKVAQVIFMNRKHLGMDDTQALKDVGYLNFTDIDTHGFGEDDVIVAQGELNITLSEFFS